MKCKLGQNVVLMNSFRMHRGCNTLSGYHFVGKQSQGEIIYPYLLAKPPVKLLSPTSHLLPK